ncbi:hypothetical protein ON010_g16897 [Phytophthora cinnamomi]|nr:hypothetical protein ON010_g16897 [Phytophthora cinnamomi]
MVSPEEPARLTAFGTPERRSSCSHNASPFLSTSSQNVGLEHSATGSICTGNEDDADIYEVDDIVAHWDTVLSALEDGDDSDLQALLASADAINRGEVASEENEEEEAIMPPVRHSFPDHDDKRFPQEPLVLKGLRGRKVPLAELLTSDSDNGTNRSVVVTNSSAEGTNNNTSGTRLDFTNLEDD